ncbi:MAG: hypothetical protein V4689_12940 [Verrucomicrobiota bacterium]
MTEKHPNAPDEAGAANYAVGRKATFREIYPQVVSLEVEIKATPMGFGQAETYQYTLDTVPGQFTPCPNTHCCDGGFDTGSFLTQLVSSGETAGETGSLCVGVVKAGRSVRRGCNYAFSGKAVIAYVEQ